MIVLSNRKTGKIQALSTARTRIGTNRCDQLRDLVVPLPPLAEQPIPSRFVDRPVHPLRAIDGAKASSASEKRIDAYPHPIAPFAPMQPDMPHQVQILLLIVRSIEILRVWK